jgi:wyosine [tRNA(Phe)-imidazoG37] synthetase (radical SAM superfamily)
MDRKEYVPYKSVIEEIEHYIKNNTSPDYITFSGSGEPTLNNRIGDIIRYIKNNIPNLPVAVLTNGTLLYQKKVRNELLDGDVVLPSLDAASDLIFRKINRPLCKLNAEQHIQGLINFRKEFKGKIWLEVFIIPGYNDNLNELDLLKKAFEKIKPDLIQLNTLDRPGALSKIRAATKKELQQIGDYWQLNNIEIVAISQTREIIKSYRKDYEEAILETISRRPCTMNDLSVILGSHLNEVNKYLDVLESDGKIKRVIEKRGVFYKIKT